MAETAPPPARRRALSVLVVGLGDTCNGFPGTGIRRLPCNFALARARLVQARKPAPAQLALAWIASAHALTMRSGCASRVAAPPLAAVSTTATTAASSAAPSDIICCLSR